ncbi:MAG: hypothetical protein HN686_06690 [Bacteroidetes bacterium]|jgi:hypothetical protein|nr:hypothetical protein [Bacteroidota bacterium]
MNQKYLKLTLPEFLQEISSKPSESFDGKEYSYPNGEYSEIEIFNYFEQITGEFKHNKVKQAIDHVDFYTELFFIPRIQKESLDIYIEHNWEIPSRKDGGILIDIEKMAEAINVPGMLSPNEIMDIISNECTVRHGKIINLPNCLESFVYVEYDYDQMFDKTHLTDFTLKNMQYAHDLLSDNLIPESNENIDLYEKNQTETMVVLHELGVLDFLVEKFGLRDNYAKFANVLRSFVDLNHDTTRRMLSALYSSDDSDKNIPTKEKNISRVHGELITLGLDTSKFKTQFNKLGEK